MKQGVIAVNAIIKLDEARRTRLLDEVQMKQVDEAEALLRGLSGSRVVDALLSWRRSGLAGLG